MILCSTLSQRAAHYGAKAAVRSKEFSPASSLCEQSLDRFSVMRGRFAYVIGQRICAFAHVRVKRLSDSKRSGTAERISIHDVQCMMKAFVFDDRSGKRKDLRGLRLFYAPARSFYRKKENSCCGHLLDGKNGKR